MLLYIAKIGWNQLVIFFNPKYFKSNLLLLKVIGPIPEPYFTGFEYPILFFLYQGQKQVYTKFYFWNAFNVFLSLKQLILYHQKNESAVNVFQQDISNYILFQNIYAAHFQKCDINHKGLI